MYRKVIIPVLLCNAVAIVLLFIMIIVLFVTRDATKPVVHFEAMRDSSETFRQALINLW